MAGGIKGLRALRFMITGDTITAIPYEEMEDTLKVIGQFKNILLENIAVCILPRVGREPWIVAINEATNRASLDTLSDWRKIVVAAKKNELVCPASDIMQMVERYILEQEEELSQERT